MNEINITSAQYVTDPLTSDTGKIIKATINGTEMWIGVDSANRHYAEIMRQVDSGTLTIEDAD